MLVPGTAKISSRFPIGISYILYKNIPNNNIKKTTMSTITKSVYLSL